jgi:hypothetical protein
VLAAAVRTTSAKRPSDAVSQSCGASARWR